MDINKVIAENLTAWMKDSRTLDTVKKVEQVSGVGFGTVRRAKNGEGNITAKNMELIAKAFGRHPSELMLANTASTIVKGEYSQIGDGSKPYQCIAEPTTQPAAPQIDLSNDEKKIINGYRAADARGRAALIWMAESCLGKKSPLTETTDFAPKPPSQSDNAALTGQIEEQAKR